MRLDGHSRSLRAVQLGALADDDPGGLAREDDGAHLLEGHALGLGQDEVEEEGIRKVADGEEHEEPPAHALDGDARHLADQRVKREARHRG